MVAPGGLPSLDKVKYSRLPDILMRELLGDVAKAEKLPMSPFGFGGKIILTLYWYGFRLFFRHKENFLETCHQLNKPYKAMAFVYAQIEYALDKRKADEWQPAVVTWERRKGDCEDWAIFFSACLQELYHGFYLCMYNRTSGHCEYLIPINGGKRWISLGTYGLNWHKGSLREIIVDWEGFKNWTEYRVLNDEFVLIEKGTRG